MNAESLAVHMNRADTSIPWGFRLQGGKEFGAPLAVSRVNPGSVAERAGLREGDILLQLFGKVADQLKHKDAQDAILEASNSLDVVVERGAVKIWSPIVKPADPSTGTAPKYSLAHDHREVQPIPGHNTPAKPFTDTVPRTMVSSNPTVATNLQYNTPTALYSKSSAAEAYLQQTGGLFGTDPKLTQEKPEPAYLQSATLKLIHEAEKSGKTQAARPAPDTSSNVQYEPTAFQSKTFTDISHNLGQDIDSSRHVPFAASAPAPAGAPICDICGRAILNVFAKAGDKNLHPDCFNCATCGTNLKNKGFFNIRDKLYCEIHARQQNENQFKATPPVDPNVFAGRAPPPPKPVLNNEPIKAFYQPDIMKRGGIVHPPKATKLSPQSRGVPTHHGDLYDSSIYNTMSSLNPSNYYQQERYSPKPMAQNLPPSTAPFSSASPHNFNSAPLAVGSAGKFRWPPKSVEEQPSALVTHPWKVPSDFETEQGRSVSDDYQRIISYKVQRSKDTPSPKRYVLTEDVGRQQEWKLERLNMEAEILAVRNDIVQNTLVGSKAVHPPFETKVVQKPIDASIEQKAALDTKMDVSGDFIETFENFVVAPKITTTISFEQTGPMLDGQKLQRLNDPNFTSYSTTKTQTHSMEKEGVNENVEPGFKVKESEEHSVLDIGSTTKSLVKTILKKSNVSKSSQGSQITSSELSEEILAKPRTLDIVATDFDDQFDISNYPPWRNPPSHQSGGGSVGFTPIGVQSSGASAPKRGRGILKQLHEAPRIPICEHCNAEIRGPFVLALGKTWCPDHFVCSTPSCHRKLLDIGFVEEQEKIFCEYCFEKYYAPHCTKCSRPITGDCLTALQHQWHPDCFTCVQCHKPFGNASFFVENGQPICENDYSSFATKCANCQFAIEAGDRFVEALGNPYHSDCFTCTVCQKNLEGQNFYAKGNKPYCKSHA